jgi:glycosyltransferase involved in cell wall biosynthesis
VSADPFFTVVIPVYNRANVLGEAIRSVLAQSEQDFEIVIVDDGSRDDPKPVVDAFADPRIRYIHQENRGGGAARNAGIDAARGVFIAFLDSDDVFLPDHLTAMRKLLEGRTNVAAYARIVVDRGEGRTFLKPPRAIRAGENMATYLLCDRGFVPTITLVVDAVAARQVRYDATLPFGQDTDFAIRLYLAGCSFVMAEEPGAVWRDAYDPNRASAGRKGARLTAWLDNLRSRIPAKAYDGARGWLIAKGLAPSNTFGALELYLRAVLKGCYRPKLALTIFLQIFVPDRIYRRLADGLVTLFKGAVWSQGERGAPPRAQILPR